MPRLALIDLGDNSVIREVPPGGWVALPNGNRVSPAVAGWRGGGAITYEKSDGMERATEGPPAFTVVEVDRFVVPDGKRIVGASTLAYDTNTGRAVETAVVEDAIQVRLAATEKVAAMLASHDLTLDELTAVLSGMGG